MIVYKTVNKINGKIYVGKDKNNNPDYIGSGRYLRMAIKHYGRENFQKEILEECSSIEELNLKEKYWIQKLNTIRPNGYNLTEGGDGGDVFTNKPEYLKEITKKKISKASKRANAKNRNLHSENTKKLWQNKEWANKVLAAHKKAVSAPEYRNKISKAMTGRIMSPEHRQALSEHNKIRMKKSLFIETTDILTSGAISTHLCQNSGVSTFSNILTSQVTNQLSNQFGVSSDTIERKYTTWIVNDTNTVREFFNKRANKNV